MDFMYSLAMPKMTYKEAGVDIDNGERLVDWIKTLPSKNRQQINVLDGVGGFAALFKLAVNDYKDPLLVSATDGVGTKLKWAIETNTYDTIGQDLVAMCVNDLICVGATPLFFLDYYSVGELELEKAKPFIGGVKAACELAECALIGGETAEMPGMYSDGDFDCAGFAVGIVDRSDLIGAKLVKPNQDVIALSSSGFHSNGYSLLRKVHAESSIELKKQLLKPTEIYVSALDTCRKVGGLSALCHITGGGIRNLSRVLPEDVGVELQPWEIPDPFLYVQKVAGLETAELLETFNCGVGLFAIVEKDKSAETVSQLAAAGYTSWVAGTTCNIDGEPKKQIMWRQ